MCASSSPAGQASSARTSPTPSSRGATRFTWSTTSRADGGRTSRRRPALEVDDIRDGPALDALFERVRPTPAFTSPPRPTSASRSTEPDVRRRRERLGTVQVLEAAFHSHARLVFASTGGAIYGECERPAREDGPRQPLSPYGAVEARRGGIPATYSACTDATGRPALGNVYGPRQDPHGEAGVVAIFLGLLAGETAAHLRRRRADPRLRVRRRRRPRDARSARAPRSGVFNVGTGRESSVLDLFQACLRVSGVDVEPEFAPARAGELGRSVLDPGLAERELAFRPEVRARRRATRNLGLDS